MNDTVCQVLPPVCVAEAATIAGPVNPPVTLTKNVAGVSENTSIVIVCVAVKFTEVVKFKFIPCQGSPAGFPTIFNTCVVFVPVPASTIGVGQPPNEPVAPPLSPASKPKSRSCEYPNEKIIRNVNNVIFFITKNLILN